MRSIETLARNNPELTGRELFELQEQEKIEEAELFEEENKEKLELIKSMNLDRDGGFYKGRLGNYHFLYHYMAVELGEKGKIFAKTCEKIKIFNTTVSNFKVEIELNSFNEFYMEDLDSYEKITRDEFFEVRDYFVKSVKKFW